LDRIGRFGISVPGFGIGNSATGSYAPAPSSLRPSIGAQASPSSPQVPPRTGTTWAEKQAALKTASNLRNNPGAVSLSDIRTAAGTTKNFHDRHGDQVLAGMKAANQANQKYGLSTRAANLSLGTGKQPPPPPPPKPNLGSPPPLPLSSKPKPY
jgi:hypothetical protein